MKKESHNYKMTSIMVDPKIYDKFVDTLPRNKSFGEAMREYMTAVVEEEEKKKKVVPPAKGAIIYTHESNKKVSEQITLDIYKMDKIEVRNTLRKIEDPRKLIDVRDTAEIILSDSNFVLKALRRKIN